MSTEATNQIESSFEPFLGPNGDFCRTVRALFSTGAVTDTLEELAQLAVNTIEGCDFAGIFTDQKGTAATVCSDPIVGEIDSLQRGCGAGPAIHALVHQAIICVDDLSDDPRWPTFGHATHTLGIRSVLALPIFTADGVLNLYAQCPFAFSVVDRGKGVILVSLASTALSVARSREEGERRADNLRLALGTRELIGQAEGILMERERITAEKAFDILRHASQHLNVKLRDVAQRVVDTGEQPETGPDQLGPRGYVAH